VFCTSRPLLQKIYTKSHEWANVDGDVATVGITDYAQSSLGDVVFVSLPAVGTKLKSFESFGNVESVKATSECQTPVGGEVVEINKSLEESPDLINKSAEGDAWMFKLKNVVFPPNDQVMTPQQYKDHVKDL